MDALKQLLEQPTNALTVEVDEAQIRRAIVALTITAPNSIRAIEDMLPLIYPDVTVPAHPCAHGINKSFYV